MKAVRAGSSPAVLKEKETAKLKGTSGEHQSPELRTSMLSAQKANDLGRILPTRRDYHVADTLISAGKTLSKALI